MGRCIVYTGIRLSLQFSNIKIFCNAFLRNCETWKVETWYTHGQRADVSCIPESGCCFISAFFFLSNFQTLKCFITLFSGTVRLRRLKLVAHMDNGWMYHVYRNHDVALTHPFIFHFLSNFQALKCLSSHFSQELWGLQGWNLVLTWTVGRCIVYTRIRLLLLIHPFVSSFSFSPIVKH